VTVYDGTTQLGTVTAGATGAWSFTLGVLSEGAHKLSATATDNVGNTSASSDVLSFTVDTQAPGAPTGLADAKIVGGYVNAAHDVANQALTGKAQAYAFVTVYDGATKLGQVQAAGTGDWSYTLGHLADGDHSLSAVVADKAGNVGPASTHLDFTVDTHAPPLSLLPQGAFDGALGGDVELDGLSETGATIVISDGATKLASTVVDHTREWTLLLPGVANGQHDFIVTTTDPAGNTATTSLLYNLVDAPAGGPPVTLTAAPKLSDTVVDLPAGLPPGVTFDAATKTFTLDTGNPAYQEQLGAGQTATVAVDYDVIDGTKTTPAVVTWNISGRTTFFKDGDTVLTGQAHAPGETFTVPSGEFYTVVGDVHGLSGQAQGGDDVMSFYATFLNSVYGDALTISDHARGGDDQIYANVIPGVAVVGDAETLSDYGVGGGDTLTSTGFGSTGIGDATSLTDHARGGGDLITALGSGDKGWGEAYGDGVTMSGYAVGGDDTITGRIAYGDARTVSDHAKGGDDLVQGVEEPPVSYAEGNLLYGDGGSLLGYAQGGNDTLVGDDPAPDYMWGDAATISATATTGADLFVFHPNNGQDQIMDFQPGKDRIEIDGYGVSGFTALVSHLQATADGVLITLDANDTPDTVLVRGVTIAQLSAGDFVFG
jgi:hypothetical protein